MTEPIISTSYVLENDVAWQKSINDALRYLGDLTSVFKLIARDFYKSEMAIFTLKSAGKYPDFKNEESREAKMRAVGFEYPLLLRSGKLMRSVTQPDADGSVLDIKPTYMLIGTDVRNDKGVSYGIFHQSDKPRKVIPLRKFLFIGPEAPRYATSDQMGRLERWQKTMKTYVDKKLESMGKVK